MIFLKLVNFGILTKLEQMILTSTSMLLISFSLCLHATRAADLETTTQQHITEKLHYLQSSGQAILVVDTTFAKLQKVKSTGDWALVLNEFMGTQSYTADVECGNPAQCKKMHEEFSRILDFAIRTHGTVKYLTLELTPRFNSMTTLFKPRFPVTHFSLDTSDRTGEWISRESKNFFLLSVSDSIFENLSYDGKSGFLSLRFKTTAYHAPVTYPVSCTTPSDCKKTAQYLRQQIKAGKPIPLSIEDYKTFRFKLKTQETGGLVEKTKRPASSPKKVRKQVLPKEESEEESEVTTVKNDPPRALSCSLGPSENLSCPGWGRGSGRSDPGCSVVCSSGTAVCEQAFCREDPYSYDYLLYFSSCLCK